MTATTSRPLAVPATRTTPTRILELGVKQAGSIKAWLEAFPNAEVVGVDVDATSFKHPRFVFIQANQSDTSWQSGQRPFDIVVDDASHQFRDQVDTCCKFWPLLKSDGHDFIEDIRAYQKNISLDCFAVLGGTVHPLPQKRQAR